MKAERLLELYERVADAPDAVEKLRRFVLDLAVRGKLVAQAPNDEPASELLAEITAEKLRLAQLGEIRKPKLLPPVGEVPFSVPNSWQWCRIREVTSDRGQMMPNEAFTYVDVTSIDKTAGVVADPKVLEPRDAPSRARKVTRRGDVLYSCVRPYLLNVAIVEEDFSPPPIASTAFAVINGHNLVLPRYTWIVLRSVFMVACVEAAQRGQAYPAINDSDFAILPFPLPPLAEQHRIVAKVDELMGLLDRLEETRKAREATRDRLAAASLSRLTAAPSVQGNEEDAADETANTEAERSGADAFRTHAQFALDALPSLTTRPDQIKLLRQTILDLAVRGKLVGTNEEVLASIPQDATFRLRSKGIPPHWQCLPLSSLLSEGTRNGYSRRPDDDPNGAPILRISAGTARLDGLVAEEEHKLISGIDNKTRSLYGLNRGDLLACRFNGNKAFVGRLTIFTDYLGLTPIFPDKLIRVRLDQQVAFPEYIRIAGDSDLVRRSVGELCATTVGNWGISAANLKNVMFPIPPLAEQRRIVAKVNELTALCDQLERALESSDHTRAKLLDAVLREALAGADTADEQGDEEAKPPMPGARSAVA